MSAAVCTAAPAAELPAQILQQLAGCDSKKPARAADVAALVGAPEPAFWAALEQLKASAQINCAVIQRAADPEPWMAVWPTGVPSRTDSWKDLNARGHFAPAPVSAAPPRFPRTPDPTRDPRPDLRATTTREIASMTAERSRKRGEITAHVEAALRGTPRAAALSAGEAHTRVAACDDTFPAAVVAEALKRLANKGVLATDQRKRPDGHKGPRYVTTYYDAAMADAPAESAAQPAPGTRLEFALWDDGRLDIYDGDSLRQLAPADTARLARLLGVPGDACAGGAA